ncbi:MAG TPA: hypothetical protein VGK17_24820 [Propionicimonas sp.]
MPPPGAHDLSYFGIFSSHDAHRRLFVRPRRKDPDRSQAHAALDAHDDELRVLPQDPDSLLAETVEEERYVRWADLMRKVHGLEVLDCPCGGKRKVVELLRDPTRVLRRRGSSTGRSVLPLSERSTRRGRVDDERPRATAPRPVRRAGRNPVTGKQEQGWL